MPSACDTAVLKRCIGLLLLIVTATTYVFFATDVIGWRRTSAKVAIPLIVLVNPLKVSRRVARVVQRFRALLPPRNPIYDAGRLHGEDAGNGTAYWPLTSYCSTKRA